MLLALASLETSLYCFLPSFPFLTISIYKMYHFPLMYTRYFQSCNMQFAYQLPQTHCPLGHPPRHHHGPAIQVLCSIVRRTLLLPLKQTLHCQACFWRNASELLFPAIALCLSQFDKGQWAIPLEHAPCTLACLSSVQGSPVTRELQFKGEHLSDLHSAAQATWLASTVPIRRLKSHPPTQRFLGSANKSTYVHNQVSNEKHRESKLNKHNKITSCYPN